MRKKTLFDRDRLVSIGEYATEALAALDQALLEAADIPSMIQRDRAGEVRERARLIIRAEDLPEAQEVLDGPAGQ